ncbi:MAG: tripartite tricarboxylate transporter substrate binding protein, partial [Betaproteobacteria bacterium]|nr:tripartite tricarboxylate transporter substrate binding protein [Betaproteobacteria bacterium]
LQVPDLRERLLDLGFESVGSTPEEFADYCRAEAVKWTNLIKKAGIKVN